MSANEIIELCAKGGGLLLLLSMVIQVSPLKLNPWSWVGNLFMKFIHFIGKCINGPILKELEDMRKDMKETRERLEKHIKDDDYRDMVNRRQRILRYNADLIDGKNFTHEYFVDMLADIDIYEKFCKDHTDFENSRAVMAIYNIRRVYQINEESNSFAK